MDAATLAPSVAISTTDAARIRDIILVRAAVETREMTRAEIAKDIGSIFGSRLSAADCRHAVDRNLAALADAGLVTLKTVAVAATTAGRKRGQMVLGGKAPLPKSWREARDVRLVAKALGLEDETGARLKLLLKPDGLKAAIVQQTFGITLRGAVTPSRLRARLAAIALERAFGKSGANAPAKKTGLSAKDGRSLAGQLTTDQKHYGTDGRLVAALAMQAVGVASGEFAGLQQAVLRRYAEGSRVLDDVVPGANGRGQPKRARGRKRELRHAAYQAPVQLDFLLANQPHMPAAQLVRARPTETVVVARPDLATFAVAVLGIADRIAEGWPGNRKAFICRVWRATALQRPEWGLSEIEFKAMLTEAHRAGNLVLAHADLKDSKTLKDVQDSQIAYKNAVFHFIRADG